MGIFCCSQEDSHQYTTAVVHSDVSKRNQTFIEMKVAQQRIERDEISDGKIDIHVIMEKGVQLERDYQITLEVFCRLQKEGAIQNQERVPDNEQKLPSEQFYAYQKEIEPEVLRLELLLKKLQIMVNEEETDEYLIQETKDCLGNFNLIGLQKEIIQDSHYKFLESKQKQVSSEFVEKLINLNKEDNNLDQDKVDLINYLIENLNFLSKNLWFPFSFCQIMASTEKFLGVNKIYEAQTERWDWQKLGQFLVDFQSEEVLINEHEWVGKNQVDETAQKIQIYKNQISQTRLKSINNEQMNLKHAIQQELIKCEDFTREISDILNILSGLINERQSWTLSQDNFIVLQQRKEDLQQFTKIQADRWTSLTDRKDEFIKLKIQNPTIQEELNELLKNLNYIKDYTDKSLSSFNETIDNLKNKQEEIKKINQVEIVSVEQPENTLADKVQINEAEINQVQEGLVKIQDQIIQVEESSIVQQNQNEEASKNQKEETKQAEEVFVQELENTLANKVPINEEELKQVQKGPVNIAEETIQVEESPIVQEDKFDEVIENQKEDIKQTEELQVDQVQEIKLVYKASLEQEEIAGDEEPEQNTDNQENQVVKVEEKTIPYVAVEEDELDVAVANYVEKERPQLDIKRVEKGKYTISNVNVSLRLNDGEIQVKSGSVLYITLTEYLTIKLQNIGATLLDIASNSPEGKAAAKKKKKAKKAPSVSNTLDMMDLEEDDAAAQTRFSKLASSSQMQSRPSLNDRDV